ncbi:MAG: T9SS type A sorting domain-containing protein, partial [Lentimicrobium sp.]|nr:T9SS type A sorting domain-containing protein [Lentimicrobium sp.]
FYNSNKLELKSYEVVQSTTRDIDLFTLYYKSSALTQGDTIFIHCLVAHLKAGNTGADATTRAAMTANMISYLQSNKEPGNYLFMGDLNTYTSEELCYQHVTDITAADFRFFDPIAKPGDWNNSSTYAAWHTQSVTTSSNGCQSSGGMDDRFDHILATAQIINGSMGLKYIDNSYQAVGQDGRHFNKSLTDSPINTSVPAEVLTALFNNSDHLPVRLKLEVNAGSAGGINNQAIFRNAGIYLVSQEMAHLFVTSENELPVRVSVISLTGQLVKSENMNLNRGRNEMPLDIRNLKKGVYIIRIADSLGRMASIKLVK